MKKEKLTKDECEYLWDNASSVMIKDLLDMNCKIKGYQKNIEMKVSAENYNCLSWEEEIKRCNEDRDILINLMHKIVQGKEVA